MSLRKSPTRTAAFLAANRRNAQKSTGPRTRQGKARSYMNGLRHGRRSRILHPLLPDGFNLSDPLVRERVQNTLRRNFQWPISNAEASLLQTIVRVSEQFEQFERLGYL